MLQTNFFEKLPEIDITFLGVCDEKFDILLKRHNNLRLDVRFNSR